MENARESSPSQHHGSSCDITRFEIATATSGQRRKLRAKIPKVLPEGCSRAEHPGERISSPTDGDLAGLDLTGGNPSYANLVGATPEPSLTEAGLHDLVSLNGAAVNAFFWPRHALSRQAAGGTSRWEA
jgi:hypothetical protein